MLATFAADRVLDKVIPDDIKKTIGYQESEALALGGAAGFLTTGVAAPMAVGALAGLETSKFVGSKVGEMLKDTELNPVVKQHAQVVAEGASGGAMAGIVTRGIGKLLGGAALEAVGIATTPFGGVAADVAGGVLFAEGINEIAQVF